MRLPQQHSCHVWGARTAVRVRRRAVGGARLLHPLHNLVGKLHSSDRARLYGQRRPLTVLQPA